MTVKNKSPRESKKRRQRYSLLKQALEPRILYDASLAAPSHDVGAAPDSALDAAPPDASQIAHEAALIDATGPVTAKQSDNTIIVDGAMDTSFAHANDTSNVLKLQEFSTFSPPPRQLIFIDSRLLGTEDLLKNLTPGTEVHFIDASQDGIQQMDTIIRSDSAPIAAIHILSHGGEGAVEIGSSLLTTNSLNDRYASELAGWQSHLSADANLLLYSCGVAGNSPGRQFVSDLSDALGIAVAASTDATGSSMLGGNWELEFQTGEIHYAPTGAFSEYALDQFYFVLAKPIVDLNGPASYTITEDFSSGTYSGGTNWTSDWLEFDASSSRAFAPAGSTYSDNSPISGNIIEPGVADGGRVE